MAWIYIVGDVLFLDLDPWCETNEFGFGFGLRWFLGKLASLAGICIMMCNLCVLTRLCFRVNYLPLPMFPESGGLAFEMCDESVCFIPHLHICLCHCI